MSALQAFDSPLASLGPVHLDELVACASLLSRVDRKYVVPGAELCSLLAAAPGTTRVLEIEGHRVFGYRSTYLDTPDRACYLRAGQRRRLRFKVRTRSYLGTEGSWLEVKTRAGRGTTVKQRMPHPDAGAAPLTSEGLAFVDDRLAAAGVPAPPASVLEPVLVTAYSRSTLLLPGHRSVAASRVTIDTDLGWTSLVDADRHGARRDLDRPRLAIVETKTGSGPSAFDRLLWARGHRPVRISKYGVGMAALHPELPRLKWHRVLTRQLSVPT